MNLIQASETAHCDAASTALPGGWIAGEPGFQSSSVRPSGSHGSDAGTCPPCCLTVAAEASGVAGFRSFPVRVPSLPARADWGANAPFSLRADQISHCPSSTRPTITHSPSSSMSFLVVSQAQESRERIQDVGHFTQELGNEHGCFA
jgi:hypothetical protein